jgi:hypothetical protein
VMHMAKRHEVEDLEGLLRSTNQRLQTLVV